MRGRARLFAMLMTAGLLALTSGASAQEKKAFSFKLPAGVSTITQRHGIDVGDVPGHQISIVEYRAIYAGGDAPEFDGIKVTEQWDRHQGDLTAGNGRASGYRVFVMADGDRVFARAETLIHATVQPDGKRKVTYTQVITLTGGTGKFARIRGTLRAIGSTDFVTGASDTQTQGEYWLEPYGR